MVDYSIKYETARPRCVSHVAQHEASFRRYQCCCSSEQTSSRSSLHARSRTTIRENIRGDNESARASFQNFCDHFTIFPQVFSLLEQGVWPGLKRRGKKEGTALTHFARQFLHVCPPYNLAQPGTSKARVVSGAPPHKKINEGKRSCRSLHLASESRHRYIFKKD